MRYPMYTVCISLEVHCAFQLRRTFGVATLKLSLIFGKSKMRGHMLFKNIFLRYRAHPFFVRELVISNANKAYWVWEYHGIRTWILNGLAFASF